MHLLAAAVVHRARADR